MCVITIHYVLMLSSPQHRTPKRDSGVSLCLEDRQLGSAGPGDGVRHASGLGEGLELEKKSALNVLKKSVMQPFTLVFSIPEVSQVGCEK